MWKPGTPITLTATDTAQQLTSSVGLVKAVRIFSHWNNTHRIVTGDANLNVNAVPVPTGVTGWAPPPPVPPSDAVIPFIEAYEHDALNGVNANQIYVSGFQDEIVLWSYIEQ